MCATYLRLNRLTHSLVDDVQPLSYINLKFEKHITKSHYLIISCGIINNKHETGHSHSHPIKFPSLLFSLGLRNEVRL